MTATHVDLPFIDAYVDGPGRLLTIEMAERYATAAVLADRQALLVRPVHLQGDEPFMKADVEAICAIAVAAALKYGKEPARPDVKQTVWVRTLNGEIDWGEDCIGPRPEDLQIDSMNEYAEPGEVYTAAPFYTALPPAVPDGWQLVPIKAPASMLTPYLTIEQW